MTSCATLVIRALWLGLSVLHSYNRCIIHVYATHVLHLYFQMFYTCITGVKRIRIKNKNKNNFILHRI